MGLTLTLVSDGTVGADSIGMAMTTVGGQQGVVTSDAIPIVARHGAGRSSRWGDQRAWGASPSWLGQREQWEASPAARRAHYPHDAPPNLAVPSMHTHSAFTDVTAPQV
jgi:hypothetical protein